MVTVTSGSTPQSGPAGGCRWRRRQLRSIDGSSRLGAVIGVHVAEPSCHRLHAVGRGVGRNSPGPGAAVRWGPLRPPPPERRPAPPARAVPARGAAPAARAVARARCCVAPARAPRRAPWRARRGRAPARRRARGRRSEAGTRSLSARGPVTFAGGPAVTRGWRRLARAGRTRARARVRCPGRPVRAPRPRRGRECPWLAPGQPGQAAGRRPDGGTPRRRASSISLVVAGIAGGPGGGGPAGLAARPGAGPVSRAAGSGAAVRAGGSSCSRPGQPG